MKVYLLLAEGFETIEALSVVDVLRRGGVDITTVSISNEPMVTSSQGVPVLSDVLLEEVDITDGDALILPGGYPGYDNLRQSPAVIEALQAYDANARIVALICGAPIILQDNAIRPGIKVTGHSCIKNDMTAYTYTGNAVERDGHIITAIGAGHSVAFGLTILEALCGESVVAKVKQGMELK